MEESTRDALTELRQRLDRLERENHRLKSVGLGVMSVVAAVLCAGAASSPKVLDEVRARKFVLVQADGRERGVLQTSPLGTHFFLRGGGGPNESKEVVFSINAQSTGMISVAAVPNAADPGADVRAVTLAVSAGYKVLNIPGDDGAARIRLSTDLIDGERIAVHDKEGKVVWKAP